MTDEIRQQIAKLREYAESQNICGVDAGRTSSCNADWIMDEAADTMERLLAVYEAAQALRKTEGVSYVEDDVWYDFAFAYDSAAQTSQCECGYEQGSGTPGCQKCAESRQEWVGPRKIGGEDVIK